MYVMSGTDHHHGYSPLIITSTNQHSIVPAKALSMVRRWVVDLLIRAQLPHLVVQYQKRGDVRKRRFCTRAPIPPLAEIDSTPHVEQHVCDSDEEHGGDK